MLELMVWVAAVGHGTGAVFAGQPRHADRIGIESGRIPTRGRNRARPGTLCYPGLSLSARRMPPCTACSLPVGGNALCPAAGPTNGGWSAKSIGALSHPRGRRASDLVLPNCQGLFLSRSKKSSPYLPDSSTPPDPCQAVSRAAASRKNRGAVSRAEVTPLRFGGVSPLRFLDSPSLRRGVSSVLLPRREKTGARFPAPLCF
jgi:hypothetical protein